MTREEKIFEMSKAIAPVFVKEGTSIIKRIVECGKDPAKCVIDDKDIFHAYGKTLKIWATAFVDELEKEEQSKQ